MNDYTIEQAKIDIARLQSQVNAYERIAKAYPNLLNVRGDLKLKNAPTVDLHAATKKYVDDNSGTYGWIPTGETWTYASSTTITISGDKTDKYSVGMKVKLTQTSVKYFYITDVSYSSPDTTLTIVAGDDYTVANAAITDPYYSMVANPAGFPHWFNWTPIIGFGGGTTDPDSYTITAAKFQCIAQTVTTRGQIDIVNGSGDRTITAISYPPVTREDSYVGGVAVEDVSSAGYDLAACRLAGNIAVDHGTMTRDGLIKWIIQYEMAT